MIKKTYRTDQSNPQVQAYKKAYEIGKQSQHVLHKDNAWIVKRADSISSEGVFGTQKEAVEYADSLAKNQGTTLFIHGSDGRIRERKDYDTGSASHDTNIN